MKKSLIFLLLGLLLFGNVFLYRQYTVEKKSNLLLYQNSLKNAKESFGIYSEDYSEEELFRGISNFYVVTEISKMENKGYKAQLNEIYYRVMTDKEYVKYNSEKIIRILELLEKDEKNAEIKIFELCNSTKN